MLRIAVLILALHTHAGTYSFLLSAHVLLLLVNVHFLLQSFVFDVDTLQWAWPA